MAEFNLNSFQAEYIQAKMPKGYTIQLATLVLHREQRIPKKSAKYDASFKAQESVVEEAPKRPLRQPPNNELLRKGLNLLNKLQGHHFFEDVYGPVASYGQFNMKNLETQLTNKSGNIQFLIHELQRFFNICQHLYVKNPQLQEKTTQLENYFNDLLTINTNTKQTKKVSNINKSDVAMSYIEKSQLGRNIRDLNPEHLRGVWEIVQSSIKSDGDQEIEFDIEQLPTKVARRLEAYVSSKIQNKKVKTDTNVPIHNSLNKSINQESSYPSESSE